MQRSGCSFIARSAIRAANYRARARTRTATSGSSNSSSSSGRTLFAVDSRIGNKQEERKVIKMPPTSLSTLSFSSRPLSSETDPKRGLKAWPHPVIESHGDYRSESYLERHIGGPLYANQTSLPRLPIPDVSSTIHRLEPTALPLAESDVEQTRFLEACASFPGQVEQLQRRLKERRDVDMRDSSWLQLWWNTAGYLEVRDPVVVNVSYFFHFRDDATLKIMPPRPTAEPSTSTSTSTSSHPSLGVQRGAATLYAVAEYRRLVCSGTLPCETIGRGDRKTPLCSVAYKYMFNACRIPRRKMDTYKLYDPSMCAHAIVARKGRFFAVDFVNKETAEPLPLGVIQRRIARAVRLADEAEMKSNGQGTESLTSALGWLTSSDRDSWSDAREELIRVGGGGGGNNGLECALEELESGAVLLCMDDEEPVTREQCGNLFWTGTFQSGRNRWFDKSIQLFVANNGKSGLLGEHSMMDGMPVVGLADHITKTTYRDAWIRSSNAGGGEGGGGSNNDFDASADNDDIDDVGAVRDIFGEFENVLKSPGSKVGGMVEKAKADFASLINAHSLTVQSFQGYGSNYIKSIGYSPDAYVQMSIQLATYRLWQKQAGTYEATQMRTFLHGRTETTRSVSPASEAFVKRMGLRPTWENGAVARGDAKDDADAAKDEARDKVSLLRDAVLSHVSYIGAAAKGDGVDRHLLGLYMLIGDGEPTPALYSDALYQRAKRWRVSTSHLTHPNFDNWGYGEVVPDGVGLSYGIKDDCVIFNVTALKEHGWTDKLSHLLEEALIEMQVLNDIVKKNEAAADPASRL